MKKKLYIIGNGFDIAHGLPTSYEDFHQYLEKKKEDKIITQIIAIINKHEKNKEKNDNEEVYWSDIEASLGKIDLDDFRYLLNKEDLVEIVGVDK